MTREMPGVDAADKLPACFFQSATIMPCESAVKRDAVIFGLRKNL